MSIEVMKQAVEALEVANSCIDGYYLPKEKAWLPEIEQAITSLRQAIAEAEKQEPVAWMSNESAYRLKHGGNSKGAVPVHAKKSTASKIPLYTHPQPKEKNT